MANFSVDAVEALEYDFTSIPSDKNPKVFCKGQGIIPEPTQKGLKAYQNAIRDLFGLDKDGDVEKAIEKSEESEEELEAKTDKLIGLTADLCQQSPSTAELMNLPPRYRMAFMSWIQKELSNPEV